MATDLLCLCRMYNVAISAYTAFAFPKLPQSGNNDSNKQCVVEVEVSWNDFTLYYDLTLIDVDKVKDIVLEVLNTWKPICTSTQPCVEKVVIRLSEACLGKFGNGFIQVPSQRSILVKSSTHMYKSSLEIYEQRSLRMVSRDMTILQLQNKDITHVIFPVEEVIMSARMFYKNPFICHDHLTYEDAKACLLHLVRDVRLALTELHTTLELAHMDVRLENMF